MSHKILVLYAHPLSRKSRINRVMKEAVAGLQGVTIHDLYEQYPDYHIGVAKEKSLLLEHDVIVLQHPFYWYSCPPLLKAWIDEVLEFGWAYGPEGTALKGKYWLQAISCGGAQYAYQRHGHNHFSVLELLRPFEQTALLCGMIPLQPLVIHSSFLLTEAEVTTHTQNYRDLLEKIHQGQLPQTYATTDQALYGSK
jgi:glutathione-regulated potassium-efflux system ancillary protein KefG